MENQSPDTPATIQVGIPAGGETLEGVLQLPHGARSVVLFAHGSGSGRHSPRNEYVARILHRAGHGTLLVDLLTRAERRDPDAAFDIERLTPRLAGAASWLGEMPHTAGRPIGLFGASTGAALALRVAAEWPGLISAVVSRGGRPDLAGERILRLVHAPTLLIVGGGDDAVIEVNRTAFAALQCRKQLQLVSGATHLFEEPGTLEEAARLATHWFTHHLQSATTA